MEKKEIMDGSENQKFNAEHIKKAISILRDVTMLVKVTPFAYAVFLVPSVVLYIFCDDSILDVIDKTMFVSPIVVVFMFMLSFKLKFCNWYRTQCALPLLPQILVFVDEYVYEFADNAVYALIGTNVIIFILSLINTYKVFLK